MISPKSVPGVLRWSQRLLVLAAAVAIVPTASHAQSGKWVATVSQLTIGGSADVTVESRNEKQSRAKVTLRNLSGKGDKRVAWDIVAGDCRQEGIPVSAQAAFQQVQTTMDGSGSATANIPKLESGKHYYVRVFDPQSSASDTNAWGCANLSEKP